MYCTDRSGDLTNLIGCVLTDQLPFQVRDLRYSGLLTSRHIWRHISALSTLRSVSSTSIIDDPNPHLMGIITTITTMSITRLSPLRPSPPHKMKLKQSSLLRPQQRTLKTASYRPWPSHRMDHLHLPSTLFLGTRGNIRKVPMPVMCTHTHTVMGTALNPLLRSLEPTLAVSEWE
jgi:hypothetical protein